MIKSITLAALLAAASLTQALEIAGDEAYPPYSFKQGGKITGIYTDIIHAALANMNESHKVISLPWKRGLSDLKNNKLDILFPPYYRPKQRPYMAYSTDILDEKLVIFCRKDKAAKLNSFPDDYRGITLGQNAGYSSGEAVEAAKKAGIIKVSEVKSTTANLRKLISKRIDCYVNDSLSIKYELAQMQKAGSYDGSSIVETHTLSVEKGYLGINTKARPEIKTFIERFNQQIENMKASGEIDQIVARYTQ